jgi:hypothetical protein
MLRHDEIRINQPLTDQQKARYQFSLVSKLLSALVPRAAQMRKCHLGNNFLPQDAPGTVERLKGYKARIEPQIPRITRMKNL